MSVMAVTAYHDVIALLSRSGVCTVCLVLPGGNMFEQIYSCYRLNQFLAYSILSVGSKDSLPL